MDRKVLGDHPLSPPENSVKLYFKSQLLKMNMFIIHIKIKLT